MKVVLDIELEPNDTAMIQTLLVHLTDARKDVRGDIDVKITDEVERLCRRAFELGRGVGVK